MDYKLKDLTIDEELEIFCTMRKNIMIYSSKKNISNFNEKELYRILSFVKDKNEVPFYENRIKLLKADKIQDILNFAFNEFKNRFNFDYKAQFINNVSDFVGLKALLLFYTIQKLVLYYYDYVDNSQKNFVDWLAEFKKNIYNCQLLLTDGCMNLNDLKLITTFTKNKNFQNYKDVIDNISSVVYNFLNQEIFYFNNLEDIKDFSYELKLEENSNIENILSTIGN